MIVSLHEESDILVQVSDMQDNNLEKRILVVDDEPNNLKLLHTLLTADGYTVHALKESRNTIELAKSLEPDLILLDINMPYLDGFEVAKLLKHDSETTEIPIIFVSAKDGEQDIRKGFEVGGIDYINKPIRDYEVIARVETHLRLREQQTKLEETINEISELRSKEQERFSKISALRNQFIQSATHDLKNPLYNIIGYVNLMKDMGAELTPGQLLQFSEHIEISSNKMTQLIGDILDLLRVESSYLPIDLRQVNFEDYLNEQVSSFEMRAAQKAITITMESPDYPVYVALDVHLFSRVIENLISNAIKYSPENSDILVRFYDSDEGVILYIEDNGYGMSQHTLENLFVPFYRDATLQQSDIEGTGLGMAIVKEIINRHDGVIDVQSEVGSGTSLQVMIPHVSAAELVAGYGGS